MGNITVHMLDQEEITRLREEEIRQDTTERGTKEVTDRVTKEVTKEVREDDLKSVIQMLKGILPGRERIATLIAENFGLQREAAEEKVALYW